MRLKLVLFLHPHIHLPSSHPFADQEGFAVFVYDCICQTWNPFFMACISRTDLQCSSFLSVEHEAGEEGFMAQYLHPCRSPHLAPRFCTQLVSLSLWPPDLLAPCPLQCLDHLLGYGRPATKRSQVSHYCPMWTVLLPRFWRVVPLYFLLYW